MTRAFTALLALAALTGCRWFTSTAIPEFDTPREQYQYATDLVSLTEPIPQEEQSHWRHTNFESPYRDVGALRYRPRDYRNFIRAFEQVASRFPDDAEYTPNAKVRVAEFNYLLGEFGLAASQYQNVLESYPQDDILQAASLFGLGNVRMAQQQYSEAQRYYGQLVREYGASEVPEIIELSQRAYFRTQQIQYQLSR